MLHICLDGKVYLKCFLQIYLENVYSAYLIKNHSWLLGDGNRVTFLVNW